MRSDEPAALAAWYRDCLGLDADDNGRWRQGDGPTVFATFESETDYFGIPRPAGHAQLPGWCLPGGDLDTMLGQPRAKGADVPA
jgi:hypothetical protein